eukprot:g18749.t1
MGSGRSCNAGISEAGSDGYLGYLWSIISNKKDTCTCSIRKNGCSFLHLDQAFRSLQDAVDGYVGRFEDESLTERTTTDEYYDVATDFYLYGWGHSFHFATRFTGESLEDSIVRHEHFLSGKLGLKPGDKVADLGMGVGGPLRQVACFTRNECSDAMARHIDYRQGDFTKLEVFQASAKALKKGAKLFSYEWVMTDRFDPANPEHVAIKKGIEIGDGIEDLVGIQVPLEALRKSGFRILEHGDLVELAEELWCCMCP